MDSFPNLPAIKPHRRSVANEMNRMAALGKLQPELSAHHAAPAVRWIACDADVHMVPGGWRLGVGGWGSALHVRIGNITRLALRWRFAVREAVCSTKLSGGGFRLRLTLLRILVCPRSRSAFCNSASDPCATDRNFKYSFVWCRECPSAMLDGIEMAERRIWLVSPYVSCLGNSTLTL